MIHSNNNNDVCVAVSALSIGLSAFQNFAMPFILAFDLIV